MRAHVRLGGGRGKGEDTKARRESERATEERREMHALHMVVFTF